MSFNRVRRLTPRGPVATTDLGDRAHSKSRSARVVFANLTKVAVKVGEHD
jgi:ribosomal protein L28